MEVLDLADGSLVVACVEMLDDTGHAAVLGPHDPAVAGRVIHLGGQQGRRRIRRPVHPHEPGDRGRADERRVPGRTMRSPSSKPSL